MLIAGAEQSITVKLNSRNDTATPAVIIHFSEYDPALGKPPDNNDGTVRNRF